MQLVAGLAELEGLLESPAPYIPSEGLRLRNQLFRGEQPRYARVAQRGRAGLVVSSDRLSPEPGRQRHLGEEVLCVVSSTATESLAERLRERIDLQGLRGRCNQQRIEVRIGPVARGLDEFHAHDRRPPEPDGRLGESLVRNELFNQPLQAVVRAWCRPVVKPRVAHVAKPGVASPVRGYRPVFRGPVQVRQGVPAAVLVPEEPHVAVVLVGAGDRVHRNVAYRAGRVVHRGVVRIREGIGILRACRGLLDVEAQEVVVGPPGAGTIAIRRCRGIASQESGRVEDSGVGVVGGQIAGIDDPPDVGRVFLHDHGPVASEVPRDFRRLEFRDILGIVKFRRRAVRGRGHRIGHDVVRGQDFRVRQVVFDNVRNELKRGASGTVLYGSLVISKSRIPPRVIGIPVRNALLGQFPTLVRQIDESHLGNPDHIQPLPVRKQPIVGGPDQELVESRACHQAFDRPAEAGFLAAADRSELGLGREPAGKQECRPTQRPPRSGHRHAFEQRVGRQPCRDVASQATQEPLHVGEVG